MFAAAANAVPLASAVLGTEIFYGSKNLLVSWNTENDNLKLRGSVDEPINAICTNGAGSLLIGTESGSIYRFNGSELSEVVKLGKAVTCLATNKSLTQWAAGCLDGKVHVYNQSNDSVVYTSATKGYALCLEFCGPLLIFGGTSNHIVVLHLDQKEQIQLVGHDNWVRSLSVKQQDEQTFVLASASQERYIRLWKFVVGGANEDDVFTTSQQLGEFSISFEALLMGHDDWVLSVQWDPSGASSQLLSSSADSSLIVWESETDSEVWTPAHRLGDLSTWGASTATGTSGGFWVGHWIEDSKVVTVTRTGSWRVWKRHGWEPVPGPTGHFGPVNDVAWFGPNLLLSTSLDQTTRLWYTKLESVDSALREVGRPQIHGYDMIAVAALDNKTFVSAGDEKVMRVFELPQQVADQLYELTGGASQFKLTELPLVAGVPALGLSNKSENEDAIQSLSVHPREDHLQRLTLWPEVDKLYGHGYEISTIAVSPQLNTVISCCKANTEQHAKLRFYSSETWHEVGTPVGGHSLTVTRLSVSPNGQHVLSVSRDRKFMVIDISTQQVVLDMPKAHTRILWDGHWFDDETFVTVSRDKSIKRWNLKGEILNTCTLKAPITAVSCDGERIIAGDETGLITVFDSALVQQNSIQLAGRINRIALQSSETSKQLAIATDLLLAVVPY